MLVFSRIRAADRPYIFQKITERTAGRRVASDYQLHHSFGTHTIVGDHLLVQILTYLTYQPVIVLDRRVSQANLYRL